MKKYFYIFIFAIVSTNLFGQTDTSKKENIKTIDKTEKVELINKSFDELVKFQTESKSIWDELLFNTLLFYYIHRYIQQLHVMNNVGMQATFHFNKVPQHGISKKAVTKSMFWNNNEWNTSNLTFYFSE